MKIQIRSGTSNARVRQITVREKTIYVCKQCHNRYYSYYFFCPQCLGVVASSTKHSSLLQIISCAPGNLEETAALLAQLSAVNAFDYAAALKSAPWVCIAQTDPAILKTWKECLEAAQVRVAIFHSAPPTRTSRRKLLPPLFAQDAPYPFFLPPSLTEEIRGLAASIASASLKLQWSETASLAFHLLEGIYRTPSERILFVDFLFQIEELLREFTRRYSSPKWSESGFLKRCEKLKESFRQMQSEIDAVREKVQDQL